MGKAGIDTVGPSAFLQMGEKYSNTMMSEFDSEFENRNYNKKNSLESQLEAELNGTSSETVEEDMSEKDDLDDDDAAVEEKKPVPQLKKPQNNLKPEVKLQKKKQPLVFAQISSKNVSKAEANALNLNGATVDMRAKDLPVVKQDTDIVYNKPTKKFEGQMLDKIKILRENSTRALQKTHVWTPAKSERQNETFNKTKYQQGNKNADLFVSFLGYIRDTTYKQSPPLFDKIKDKFSK